MNPRVLIPILIILLLLLSLWSVSLDGDGGILPSAPEPAGQLAPPEVRSAPA